MIGLESVPDSKKHLYLLDILQNPTDERADPDIIKKIMKTLYPRFCAKKEREIESCFEPLPFANIEEKVYGAAGGSKKNLRSAIDYLVERNIVVGDGMRYKLNPEFCDLLGEVKNYFML